MNPTRVCVWLFFVYFKYLTLQTSVVAYFSGHEVSDTAPHLLPKIDRDTKKQAYTKF